MQNEGIRWNSWVTVYCSPINNCVYLTRNPVRDNLMNDRTNQIDIDTLMHELMHLWVYGYSRGEDGLAWQLLIHGSTHNGLQNKSYVAFHEAFAEVSSRVLLNNIFNIQEDIYGSTQYQISPLNRNQLKDYGINSLSEIDNHEFGWIHIFNTLMCPNLEQKNLNERGFYARTSYKKIIDDVYSLSIYDIFETFKHPLPFKTREMNITGFMNRVMESVSGFNKQTKNTYIKLFDVNDTTNPKDLF